MITESVSIEYKDFVGKVAKSRGMTFDEVDAIGKGRVWTGTRGLENGLIDAYGGMKEAIAEIKTLANIQKEVELVTYPKSASAFSIKLDMDAQGVTLGDLPKEIKDLVDYIRESTFYSEEQILYLMPYILPEILE